MKGVRGPGESEAGEGRRTGARFCNASPTVSVRSSYAAPLISVITSTASNTFTTIPSVFKIGTLLMLFFTN